MTDVVVALEAMRADAKLWETASDNLKAPRSAIGGLVVTGDEFSMWAEERGIDRTYEDARTALEDMLGQAMTAFASMGASLRAAADTYEREEDANMHAMNKIMGDR